MGWGAVINPHGTILCSDGAKVYPNLCYAGRFRCRLKPSILICNVFALFFCYVNPVASHVCDVNPGVVLDSVQSQ